MKKIFLWTFAVMLAWLLYSVNASDASSVQKITVNADQKEIQLSLNIANSDFGVFYWFSDDGACVVPEKTDKKAWRNFMRNAHQITDVNEATISFTDTDLWKYLCVLSAADNTSFSATNNKTLAEVASPDPEIAFSQDVPVEGIEGNTVTIGLETNNIRYGLSYFFTNESECTLPDDPNARENREWRKSTKPVFENFDNIEIPLQDEDFGKYICVFSSNNPGVYVKATSGKIIKKSPTLTFAPLSEKISNDTFTVDLILSPENAKIVENSLILYPSQNGECVENPTNTLTADVLTQIELSSERFAGERVCAKVRFDNKSGSEVTISAKSDEVLVQKNGEGLINDETKEEFHFQNGSGLTVEEKPEFPISSLVSNNSSSGGGWSSYAPASSSATTSSTSTTNTPRNNEIRSKSQTSVLGDSESRAIFPAFAKKCEQSIKDLTDPRLKNFYNEIHVVDQSNLNRAITRAEFLKLVLNAAKIDVKNYTKTNYSDVAEDHSLINYIAYATEVGIISGKNGKFRPNDTITRAEAAKIFVNSANITLSKEAHTFSDVDKNHTLALYIQTAFDNCLLNGRKTQAGETQLANGERVYEPESNITLAETVKVLYNMVK